MLSLGADGRGCLRLVQIYTPDEENEATWHRVVYVFACLRKSCHVAPDQW